MALHIHQQRPPARPLRPGFCQRGQQNIVDLGAIGGRHLLQEGPGLRGIKSHGHTAGGFLTVIPARDVHRQPGDSLPGQSQPVVQLFPHRLALGILHQPLRPIAKWCRLGRQLDRLSLIDLLVDHLKIFQQNAPGNAVHRQVMDRQEQPATQVRPQVEIGHPHQWAVDQVQAGLDRPCVAL